MFEAFEVEVERYKNGFLVVVEDSLKLARPQPLKAPRRFSLSPCLVSYYFSCFGPNFLAFCIMFLSKNLLFLLSGALFSNLTSAKPITTITTKCSSSTSHSNSTSLSTSTFHSASPTSKPTSTTTLVPGTHTSNPAPGSSCSGQNGPTNRCAWKDNWSINTDYEAVTPDGGKTVTVRQPPALSRMPEVSDTDGLAP